MVGVWTVAILGLINWCAIVYGVENESLMGTCGLIWCKSVVYSCFYGILWSVKYMTEVWVNTFKLQFNSDLLNKGGKP